MENFACTLGPDDYDENQEDIFDMCITETQVDPLNIAMEEENEETNTTLENNILTSLKPLEDGGSIAHVDDKRNIEIITHVSSKDSVVKFVDEGENRLTEDAINKDQNTLSGSPLQSLTASKIKRSATKNEEFENDGASKDQKEASYEEPSDDNNYETAGEELNMMVSQTAPNSLFYQTLLTAPSLESLPMASISSKVATSDDHHPPSNPTETNKEEKEEDETEDEEIVVNLYVTQTQGVMESIVCDLSIPETSESGHQQHQPETVEPAATPVEEEQLDEDDESLVLNMRVDPEDDGDDKGAEADIMHDGLNPMIVEVAINEEHAMVVDHGKMEQEDQIDGKQEENQDENKPPQQQQKQENAEEEDEESINLYVTQSDGLFQHLSSDDEDIENEMEEESKQKDKLNSDNHNNNHSSSSLSHSHSSVGYIGSVSLASPVVSYPTTHEQHPQQHHQQQADDSPTQLDTYIDSYPSQQHSNNGNKQKTNEDTGGTCLDEDLLDEALSVSVIEEKAVVLTKKPSLSQGKDTMKDSLEGEIGYISSVSLSYHQHQTASSNESYEWINTRPTATIAAAPATTTSTSSSTTDNNRNHNNTNNNSNSARNKPFEIPVSHVSTTVTNSASTTMREPVTPSKLSNTTSSSSSSSVIQKLQQEIISSPEKSNNLPDLWKLLRNLNTMKDSLTNDTITSLKHTLYAKLQELTNLETTLPSSSSSSSSTATANVNVVANAATNSNSNGNNATGGEMMLSQSFGSDECAYVLSNLHQQQKQQEEQKQSEEKKQSTSAVPRRMFNTFNLDSAEVLKPPSLANITTATITTPLQHSKRKRKFGTPGSGQSNQKARGIGGGGGSNIANNKQGVEKSIFDFDFGDEEEQEEVVIDDVVKPQSKEIKDNIKKEVSKEMIVKENEKVKEKENVIMVEAAPSIKKPESSIYHQKESKQRNNGGMITTPIATTTATTATTTSNKKSDQNKSHSASSSTSSSSSSSSSSKIALNDNEYPLPAHIPPTYIHSIPSTWALLWAELEKLGWYWMKGKGLIDFYYITPKSKPNKPYALGIDYFADTQSVEDFIKAEVGKYRVRHGMSFEIHSKVLSKPVASSSTVLSDGSGMKKGHRLIANKHNKKKVIKNDEAEMDDDDDDDDDNDGNDEEEEEYFMVEDDKEEEEESYQPSPALLPSKPPLKSKSKPITDIVTTTADNTNTKTTHNSTMTTTLDIPDKPSIRSIPWKDLWKLLRSIGWCWDFGPGHLTYFYTPGYDSKRDKEAIIGIHKFTTEEEVRRYVKQQLRLTYPPSQHKEEEEAGGNIDWWKYFSYVPATSRSGNSLDSTAHSSSTTTSSSFVLSKSHLPAVPTKKAAPTAAIATIEPNDAWFGDSQYQAVVEDSHLTDPTWNLVTHRKRRGDQVLNYHLLDDPYSTTTPATAIASNGKKDETESSEDDVTTTPAQSIHYALNSGVSSSGQKKRKLLVPPSNYSNSTNTPDSMISSEDLTQKQVSKQQQAMDRTKTDNFTMIVHDGATNNNASSALASNRLQQIARPLTASSVSSSSSSSAIMKLFDQWSFIFSGIEEKPRERMEQLITKHGGKVLSDIPKQHIFASSSASLDHQIPSQTILISQAKDFRKPKYIISFLLGIPIVHYHWLFACFHAQTCLPLLDYLLPISYSLLHSSYLFVTPSSYQPTITSTSTNKLQQQVNHKKMKKEEKALAYYEQTMILQEMVVLNLTGMKIWDQIIALCGGKNALQGPGPNNHPLKASGKEYEQWLRSFLPNNTTTSTNTVYPHHIDLILFDPIIYTRSYLHHYHATATTTATNTTVPSSSSSSRNKPLLRLLELKLLQHFASLNTTYSMTKEQREVAVISPPSLVVSVDWLMHSIALQQLVNLHASDLFTLPLDPLRYPIAYKSDLEYYPIPSNTTATSASANATTTTAVTTAGERYSKYDLVNYTIPIQNTTQMIMKIGKIMGFYRRNVESKLFVRMKVLDVLTSSSTNNNNNNNNSTNNNNNNNNNTKKPQTTTMDSLIPHGTVEEQTIPVTQLLGKVILLKTSDYLRHVPTAYTFATMPAIQQTYQMMMKGLPDTPPSSSSTSGSSGVSNGTDRYFAMSRALQQLWPIIPYQPTNSNSDNVLDSILSTQEEAEESDDDEDDGTEDEAQMPRRKKARKHMQASQDF